MSFVGLIQLNVFMWGFVSMVSHVYNAVYSKEEVMTKKFIFSSAMISFSTNNVVCVMNAQKNRPIELSDFNDEQIEEIKGYLREYAELPYVVEASETVYVIIPSIYPTSMMSLVLRMEGSVADFLRLAKEREDLFVFSPNISSQASRMSARLEAKKKDFLDFCNSIENAFLRMERHNLTFLENELRDGYCEEILFLSNFFAVPIEELIVNDAEDGIPTNSNFALSVAFCSCIMMLARNMAYDRAIKIELDFSAGALKIKTSFKTDRKIDSIKELSLWESLATDRRMLFERGDEDGSVYVNFRPYVIDLSYFGMKQKPNIFE